MNISDPTPPYPPPQPRSGCVTAFMLTVGIILLIPGVLCVIVSAMIGGSANPLTMLVILMGFGGLAVIVWTVTRN
ncbi:hypothetical protein JQ633_15560 [Bradyrhizobium tropiciagri]|uniref:hypothetical protein n=1 Tax=Bradyrhizobium tropiciagri TaxID=312253 RepID=UPI001BA50C4B|nr:hypothetical protein [Bradyrhizobium tropiciagri]MBR0871781.1 hypothetical protein [Bradyrhizobium tropiciagri]